MPCLPRFGEVGMAEPGMTISDFLGLSMGLCL